MERPRAQGDTGTQLGARGMEKLVPHPLLCLPRPPHAPYSEPGSDKGLKRTHCRSAAEVSNTHPLQKQTYKSNCKAVTYGIVYQEGGKPGSLFPTRRLVKLWSEFHAVSKDAS